MALWKLNAFYWNQNTLDHRLCNNCSRFIRRMILSRNALITPHCFSALRNAPLPSTSFSIDTEWMVGSKVLLGMHILQFKWSTPHPFPFDTGGSAGEVPRNEHGCTCAQWPFRFDIDGTKVYLSSSVNFIWNVQSEKLKIPGGWMFELGEQIKLKLNVTSVPTGKLL